MENIKVVLLFDCPSYIHTCAYQLEVGVLGGQQKHSTESRNQFPGGSPESLYKSEGRFILPFGFCTFRVKKDCNLGKYPFSSKRGACVVEWCSDKVSGASPSGKPAVRASHLVAEFFSFLRISVLFSAAITLSSERAPCP